MIVAAQYGQPFNEPEPKIEDYQKKDEPYQDDRIVFGPPEDPNLDNGMVWNNEPCCDHCLGLHKTEDCSLKNEEESEPTPGTCPRCRGHHDEGICPYFCHYHDSFLSHPDTNSRPNE
jgi:hypothetical protein